MIFRILIGRCNLDGEETDSHVTKSMYVLLETALGICVDLGHFLSSNPGTNHLRPFSAWRKRILYSMNKRIRPLD